MTLKRRRQEPFRSLTTKYTCSHECHETVYPFLTCVVLGFIDPVITIFIHSMWSLGVSMEVVLAAEQFTGLLWQRGHAQPAESTGDRGGLLGLVPVPPKRPRTLVPHHTLLKIRQKGRGHLKTQELSHDELFLTSLESKVELHCTVYT